MRYFEKVSLKEFLIKIPNEESYNNITLPKRGTKCSAGYDFYSPIDVVINPHESAIISTGIKSCMNEDEVLMIFVRSSLGFKHNIRLNNTVGIIDADYYNNEDNEGHIMIKLYNPNDYEVKINANDRFAQGIFTKYLVVDNDDANTTRSGGIGSTNK